MKFKNIAIVTLINLFMVVGGFASAPGNDNFATPTTVFGPQGHTSGTNVGATKEANEPNHAGNAGGKSIWFKWTAPMTRMMQVSTNQTTRSNIDTLLNVYTGTSINNLNTIASNNNIDSETNLRSRTTFFAVEGTTYYIAVDGYSDGSTPASEGEFSLDIYHEFVNQNGDFDADGKTDLSVFRPSTGDWLVNGSTRSSSTHWGTNGDVPVLMSNYGSPRQTVFRPSDGKWYSRINTSLNFYQQFGTNGDIPVPENYYDNASSLAVFRPSNGTWYINTFNNNVIYYKFGLQGDLPVPGQYSPDQIADVAVFRPSNGTWYFMIRQSLVQSEDTFRAVKFGQAGDKPVPADYDADGLLDIAVYRPSTGTWWILQSSDGQVITYRWGIAEDIPTTGDFNGDGHADYAVFRPSTAVWYIFIPRLLQTKIEQFGQTGDIPITANRTF